MTEKATLVGTVHTFKEGRTYVNDILLESWVDKYADKIVKITLEVLAE